MFFFFVGSQFGSIVSSRGVQVCSLNVPILFSRRTFYCRFICFRNAMHIPSYVRFSSSVSFTASVDEVTIDTSHNPIVRFPKFHKMLTVRRCSSPFSALVVFSRILLELDTAPALRWPCWWRKGSSGRRKLEKT